MLTPNKISSWKKRGKYKIPLEVTFMFVCGESILVNFFQPKLTPLKTNEWHWKIPIFNRKYIFKWWRFHCHISFLGGTLLKPCPLELKESPRVWFDDRNVSFFLRLTFWTEGACICFLASKIGEMIQFDKYIFIYIYIRIFFILYIYIFIYIYILNLFGQIIAAPKR